MSYYKVDPGVLFQKHGVISTCTLRGQFLILDNTMEMAILHDFIVHFKARLYSICG